MAKKIDPATLRDWLQDGGELALIDPREQGVYYKSHLFFAISVPLSRLELMIGDLVPRRSTRIVLTDDGSDADGGLAKKAATRLRFLGYTNLYILEGGNEAWRKTGGELFSGVNVPSKAFGEFVEHAYDTPRIPAEELKGLIDRKTDMVILDSRPIEEYRRMNIPGGIDTPGAELVYRVHELAPNPETLVVVNCAGRTRSIIGAQSLINAGIPNRVVALKDGTMGWELAGFECDHGNTHFAPAPREESLSVARKRADAVAKRFGVGKIRYEQVEEFLQEKDKTVYLLDVRQPDEYAAAHVAGSTSAPGGQLVQATDEYVGTRNSRLVLIDDTGVRAIMTASWLVQLGWPEVYVLENGLEDGPVESGPPAPSTLDFVAMPTVTPEQLEKMLARNRPPLVIDVADSLAFRDKGHVPGAVWAVRARLGEARDWLDGNGGPEPEEIVFASPDGLLAHYAAWDAARYWPDAAAKVLEGGTKAWKSKGLPLEHGIEGRATTSLDDIWYKPYDHQVPEEELTQHMQAYLDWEVALVEQIERDGGIAFKKWG